MAGNSKIPPKKTKIIFPDLQIFFCSLDIMPSNKIHFVFVFGSAFNFSIKSENIKTTIQKRLLLLIVVRIYNEARTFFQENF
jgi:hypothetical protein